MPSIKVIQAAVAELPKGSPLVVAIAGGTTGIGAYIAKAFAITFASEGSKLCVYIIGRNATRAETILAEGKSVAPGSDWRFVRAADLSLLGDVDRCCAEIIKYETATPFTGGPARIDLLYMTHSSPIFEATEIKPNAEGLDTFSSTLYYSRIRFIQQLVPLLEACPNQAHVVSVYAGSFEEVKPGEEPPIGPPPPPTYGIGTVRKHVTFMKNFLFQELASQHSGKISFTHIYPGLVDGPTFYSEANPLWFKIVWRLFYPFLWLTYMTQPETCGLIMLYLATDAFPAKGTKSQDGVEFAVGTDGERGSGAYAVGQRADAGHKPGVKAFASFQGRDLETKMWAHTMEEFARAGR